MSVTFTTAWEEPHGFADSGGTSGYEDIQVCLSEATLDTKKASTACGCYSISSRPDTLDDSDYKDLKYNGRHGKISKYQVTIVQETSGVFVSSLAPST